MNFFVSSLCIVITVAAATIASPPIIDTGFGPQFPIRQPQLRPPQTLEFNYQESPVPEDLINNVKNQIGTIINNKIAYEIIRYIPITDETEKTNLIWTMEQLPLKFRSFISQDTGEGKLVVFNIGIGLQCFLVKIEDKNGQLTFRKTYSRPVPCENRIFNFE